MTFSYARSYRGPIEAVLLDWAGTTMDFGCMAPAVVFVEIYRRRKVPITIEEARAPMGAHKKVHIRKISELESGAPPLAGGPRRMPSEEDVDAMFAEFVPSADSRACRNTRSSSRAALEAVAELRKRGDEDRIHHRLPHGDDEDQSRRREAPGLRARTPPCARPTCRRAGPTLTCACRMPST